MRRPEGPPLNSHDRKVVEENAKEFAMFARGFSYRHRLTVGPAGLTNSCLSFVFHDLPVVAIDYRPFGPRSILQQKKKPIQKARMGFEG